MVAESLQRIRAVVEGDGAHFEAMRRQGEAGAQVRRWVGQLARGLHGNTHLRSLDLGFNPDFSDTALAPGCGLPGCPKPGCAQSSLEAALPHSSVLRIGLVGTDVSGAKASALHAACRANGLRAVRANDPSLGESSNGRPQPSRHTAVCPLGLAWAVTVAATLTPAVAVNRGAGLGQHAR